MQAMRNKKTTQGQPGIENHEAVRDCMVGQASWWSVSLKNYFKKTSFNLLQASESEVNMTFYMTVKNINILTAGSAALHDTDDGPKRCEYLRKINFIKKLQLRILRFSGLTGK